MHCKAPGSTSSNASKDTTPNVTPSKKKTPKSKTKVSETSKYGYGKSTSFNNTTSAIDFLKDLVSGSDVSNDAAWKGTGVLIIPVPISQAGDGIGFRFEPVPNVPLQILQYPGWVDLTVSKALGVSLRMIGTPHGDTNLPNKQAEVLGLDPDPDSPYFGQTRWQPKPTGGALVVRKDLKELHINQIYTLAQYVDDCSEKIQKVKKREAKGEAVDRQKLAAQLLNPGAFKKFFDGRKAADMVEDPIAWDGVPCPSDTA